MAIIEKMTVEEKEHLKKLCSDYKVYSNTKSEAEKLQKETGTEIKKLLDKYGFSGKEYIDEYCLQYEEQKKQVADTDKMKASGIYDMYSKTQVTKPLYIR